MSDDLETRATPEFLKILQFFFDHPKAWFSGDEVMYHTRLLPGTVYPLLVRMHKANWLDLQLEDVNPRKVGRPRKRFYKLSDIGHAEAMRVLQQGISCFDDDIDMLPAFACAA